MWDLQHDTNSTATRPNTESISSLALSSGGQLLAIAHGREIMLWDTGRGVSTHTLSGHGSNVINLIFSRDGRTLVSADESGAIKTWDLATAQSKITITSGGKVTALGLTASGQLLASAGEDYSVSVWDLQTGALRQRLKKHNDLVNALAFSPDGKLLASGGDDRSVIIWDSASGKSIRTLKGHDLGVTSLAFSPAGIWLQWQRKCFCRPLECPNRQSRSYSALSLVDPRSYLSAQPRSALRLGGKIYRRPPQRFETQRTPRLLNHPADYFAVA